jgi:hypothetical protein
MKRRGWLRLFLMALALLAMSVIPIGLVVVGSAGPLGEPTVPPPTAVLAQPSDLLFVIPPGTAAARMRGQTVVAVPDRMRLTAGQSVVVRNEDSAMHYFFYAPIAPGQTLRQTFSQPGRFGYSGFLSCSLADFDSLTVEVKPIAP